MTEIVIAFGFQIRDGQNHQDVVDHLNKVAKPAGTDVWTFPPAKPKHKVRMIFTKADFAAALDRKGAIVIYDGHSRIGQGPVFGPAQAEICPSVTRFPSNPWEDNFRMGYDLANIECKDDILEHGINPAEFPLPATSKGVFASGGLKRILDTAINAKGSKCSTQGAWRSLASCFPAVASQKNCRGVASLANRHFWNTKLKSKEFDTLVKVGDADLAKSKLACAILFMNSCSSRKHYLAALRRRKKAVKSDCVFFVTGNTCSANTTQTFLKALLAGMDVVKNAEKIAKKMSDQPESGGISFAE